MRRYYIFWSSKRTCNACRWLLLCKEVSFCLISHVSYMIMSSILTRITFIKSYYVKFHLLSCLNLHRRKNALVFQLRRKTFRDKTSCLSSSQSLLGHGVWRARHSDSLLAFIAKYGVPTNQWTWLCQALLDVSMNTIALWMHVCIDDWSAESAIKASNESKNS